MNFCFQLNRFIFKEGYVSKQLGKRNSITLFIFLGQEPHIKIQLKIGKSPENKVNLETIIVHYRASKLRKTW